ncbi:MAG: TMEM175 family protein, partial [Amnibacterium sp.]
GRSAGDPIEAEPEAADLRLSPTARTEAFSDGVFAIAITLLVLEVHRPTDADLTAYRGLLGALLAAWPSYLSYLATFLTVGVIWLNQHGVFQKIRHIDRTLQWWNLMLLLLVSFTPFPNSLLTEFLKREGLLSTDARVAAAVYALVFAGATIPWLGIWLHLVKRPELLEPGWTAVYAKREAKRSTFGVVVYTVGIVIAGGVPLLAIVLFVVAAVFYAATSGGSRSRR